MAAVIYILMALAAHAESDAHLGYLREHLNQFQGFYVAKGIRQAPRALRIVIDPSDDHLILDTWVNERTERLLEMSLDELLAGEFPAMFYFTGGNLSTVQYGNFRRAALFYFFLFYYENGERRVSLTVKEFGRTVFKIENAAQARAGDWEESLSAFLAGDYDLPPTNAVCENWLRRKP